MLDREKIKNLIELLNNYSNEYYNNQPIITDEEFDKLLLELKELENKTGIILSNSPTQNVGAISESLSKIKHTTPMLSLDKLHTVEEVIDFILKNPCIASLKEDGLTVRITYQNGNLISAETRGNGYEGTDVLNNVKTFLNLPLKIDYKNTLIIDGEAIIKYNDFEIINQNGEFALPRSAVSGSISVLDSQIAKQRRMSFICWRVVSDLDNSNTMSDDFNILGNLGFEVVPYKHINKDNIEDIFNILKLESKEKNHPIDGIVISYNNKEYAKTLIPTSHHNTYSIAYKFEDTSKETIVKNIDWSMSRNGVLTPVAIFDEVELEGTKVSRANCHNITYIKNMKLGIGDTIKVHKSNMIIPQICDNLTNSNSLNIIDICPYCGQKIYTKVENKTEVLVCKNEDCCGRKIESLSHFCSKQGMNIFGISSNIIEVLLKNNIINKYIDLYSLQEYKEKMKKIDRLGSKKVENILKSIENSKNVKLENFIVALGIPLVGLSVAKLISADCKYNISYFFKNCENNYNWESIDTIGYKISKSINSFWKENKQDIIELSNIMNFIQTEIVSIPIKENVFLDKTLVITGKLNHFNREEITNKLIALGAKSYN